MTRTHGVTHYTPDFCFGCKALTIQLPAPSGPAFKPHYNYSVGEYVHSELHFRDSLKRCAERNSISTGIDHEYEPRYGSDIRPMQEADGVLDTRARNISSLVGQTVSYD